MRTNERPTGRTRYRTQRRWFKPDVLVLQIEVEFGDGPPDHDGLPIYLEGRRWRDATAEDVSVVPRA